MVPAGLNTFHDQNGRALAYSDHGERSGAAVLVLHGAYSTHHEIETALEPILRRLGRHRRLYPDLPGMGDSPASDTINSSDDVVELLETFIDDVIGDEPVIVMGHSYGGHLGRGIAARRPGQIAGLVLLCPLVPGVEAEDREVAIAEDGADALVAADLLDEFHSYFVVHTTATAERFNAAVAPIAGRYDGAAVERIMEAEALHPDPDTTPFERPVLFVLGTSDSTVGYRVQLDVAASYPHASIIAVDGAGHALPHERPELLRGVLDDWLTWLVISQRE